MIRDLLVSKDVKDLYKQKPISITKFIKLFEKNTGMKVYCDIKRILKKIYSSSYDFDTRSFINICGSKCSGKSTLSELITLYDALRYSCLKNKTKVAVVVLSHKSDNMFFKNLVDHNAFLKLSNGISFLTITKETESNMLGRDLCAVVDDELERIDAHLEFISTSKFLESMKSIPIGMFHYINTFEARNHNNKTTLKSETIRFTINLKDRI